MTSAETEPTPKLDPRRLRVLVIEDDPDTLTLTVEMLQLMGHWATGVKTAELAIDRFFEGAFDVVLTDVELPALSGLDLAAILQERHGSPIVFATGRPAPERPMPGTVWLQKPFDIEQLRAALARAMPG